MNDAKVLRWTGAFGVAADVLLLVATPLYLVPGTPPSLGNEALFAAYVSRSNTIFITIKLTDVVYLVGFIVFAAGLRHLIRRVQPNYEWLAALAFGSALVQAASVLVFDALSGGAALDTFTRPDPSVVRGLTEASLAMNAFEFILTALFLAAVSYAILVTHARPRWTGWLGVGIAILNLAAVTAIFGGSDFMEAVIAGVTTSAGWYAYINDVRGLAYIVWLLAVSIAMMRVKPKVAPSTLREHELQEAG
jgi:hypothetical protein